MGVRVVCELVNSLSLHVYACARFSQACEYFQTDSFWKSTHLQIDPRGWLVQGWESGFLDNT